MTTQGIKYDQDKARYDLFPFHHAIDVLADSAASRIADRNAYLLMGHVSVMIMGPRNMRHSIGAVARALLGEGRENAIDWAEDVVPVLTFGAQKYGAWNWYKGMKWSRILAALQRHLSAIAHREDIDEETGLRHAQHALCCLIFMASYVIENRGENDLPWSTAALATAEEHELEAAMSAAVEMGLTGEDA